MWKEKAKRMLNVLLADDEPMILKGLMRIIDWEAEGCKIVSAVKNGEDAYNYIKDNKVDLAIVDVQMPVMTGLELIGKVRSEGITDTDFVILSGFRDFEYAQEAMKYGVSDYLTKPVKASQLESAVRKVALQHVSNVQENEMHEKLRRGYLIQYIYSLMIGKASPKQIDYIKENMRLEGAINYVVISLNNIAKLDEMTDEEVDDLKNKIRENCEEFLGEYKDHFLDENAADDKGYDMSFIFCESMASSKKMTDIEFFETLRKKAMSDIPVDLTILVGKTINDITKLSHSYSSTNTMITLRGLHSDKNVFIYDNDIHVSSHNLAKSMVHKDALDNLIAAVVRRDDEAIDQNVDELIERAGSVDYKTVNLNMNYLMFQLIHRAVEIDEMVEQDNILLYIGDDVFSSGEDIRVQLKKFSHEYAEYLEQLRQNAASGGLIKEIEHEIKDHYAENLTLRDLGAKYFINSSYLGQIFRKKFGMSFKDYLNNYRVTVASEMLINSDRKVSDIAADVGYRDVDYFVSKFYEVHGCTPTKYRRNY